MTVQEALAYLNKENSIADRFLKDQLERWRKLYYAITLHTLGAQPAYRRGNGGALIYPASYLGEEYQLLFQYKIFAFHPYEDEFIRDWRYANYRPLTRAPLAMLSEVVTGAIFQDSNFDIVAQNDADQQYLWGNNFEGNNDIAGYFSNIGYSHIVNEPNGYFIVLPKHSRKDTKAKPEPTIKFIRSIDIRYFNIKDHEIVFEEWEKKEGWFVDATTIWHFTFNISTNKYELSDLEGYYAHMLGKLPIVKAGGEWNTNGWYESYYYKALPLCDDMVTTFSNGQMTDKEASHPIIIEPNVDCDNAGCHAGFVQVPDIGSQTGYKPDKCPKCQGTGKINRFPGQRWQMEGDKIASGEHIKVITPDVAINKLHRENVKETMLMIMDTLHLTKVEEAQSGVAKAIDQERLYKFISKISNRLFDVVIYDVVGFILSYRNVKTNGTTVTPDAGQFEIVKPKQFNIETSQDLMDEYQTATTAQMPIYARRKILKSWVGKEYGSSDLMKKQSDFILFSDPLSVATPAEITALQATDEEIKYHKMLPVWLDMIIEEKNEQWFVKASFKDIQAELKQFQQTEN